MQVPHWAENLHAPKPARSSTCHNFLKLYQAFLDTVSKKSLVKLQKILGNLRVGADIGTCKISAQSDNLVTSWAKQQGSGQRHRAALY